MKRKIRKVQRTPAAKPSARSARIVELEGQIRFFEELATEADGALHARVSAGARAALLRQELAAIVAEVEASKIRDPVRRLESQQSRAAASGSWVAAAQLGAKVDEARAAQEAERQRKAEERNRDPESIVKALVGAVRRLPEALRERVVIAILQALPVTTRTRVLAPFQRGADLEQRRTA